MLPLKVALTVTVRLGTGPAPSGSIVAMSPLLVGVLVTEAALHLNGWFDRGSQGEAA
jgi:hypothetical protein